MSLDPRLPHAILSTQPREAIRQLVLDLHRQGHPKADIVQSLEVFVLQLRARGQDAEEELVLDLLDALQGWCHPDARLMLE